MNNYEPKLKSLVGSTLRDTITVERKEIRSPFEDFDNDQIEYTLKFRTIRKMEYGVRPFIEGLIEDINQTIK